MGKPIRAYISEHSTHAKRSTASGISRYGINTGNYPRTKFHTRSPEISEWNTRTSIRRMWIFCQNSNNTTTKSQWADAHWLRQNQLNNNLSLRPLLRKLNKRPNSKARRGTIRRLKGAEKKPVCFVDRIPGTQINCGKQNSSDVKP